MTNYPSVNVTSLVFYNLVFNYFKSFVFYLKISFGLTLHYFNCVSNQIVLQVKCTHCKWEGDFIDYKQVRTSLFKPPTSNNATHG